jgi:predicted alpha-1,2-mannosidase
VALFDDQAQSHEPESPSRKKGMVQMTKEPGPRALCLILATLLSLQATPAHPQNSSVDAAPAASVNPLIGTGGDPDDGINLFPGAVRPFGMVQLSPDTEDHGFGYHYIQDQIKGFSMTHMSGVGCANQGDVFFTATTGPIVTQVSDFQTPYSHANEKALPGFYQVQLMESGINAKLTATERTGMAQFTFPAGKVANVLVPISHTLNHIAAASIRVVGDRRIEGFVEEHLFCNRTPTYKVYFVMLFDRPFSTYGTWFGNWIDDQDRGGKVAEGSRAVEQSSFKQNVGAYASWAASNKEQTVTARIGISYVDVAGAERNLQAEAANSDFDTVRRSAESAWNKELSTIEVSGSSAERRTVFYTALYHSLLMPSLFDDADGRYLGFDGKIHQVAAGHHVYANFSGWDIYRSEIPLLSMVEPQRMQDMAQSVVLMYEQGGWIGRWPQINLYTEDMDGSPLSIALATAWLDGLHGFDMKTAWEGMLKDATEAPPPNRPYFGEEGVEWMNKLHYLPADKITYGSVAMTQEYSLAYASLYRLAEALGKDDDAKALYDRALDYRNVFDSEDKFFRPRNADGTWVPGFNPAQDSHGFVEGTAWHYRSFAPADLGWLVKAFGEDRFNSSMAEFFDYPMPGWYGHYFNSFNETDLQAPFVFNFSGQPWKSQQVVRRILRENYTTAPDGVPGNDDCGAMSSWAVLSMMGIYSVDPASLAYELVAPTFPKIVVHLQSPYAGKAFTVTATDSSAINPYIQHVTLNGREHTRNWIAFHDISDGGSVQFDLGPTPNRQWGTAVGDAPPSLSEAPPSTH